jgi:hypothetical protein
VVESTIGRPRRLLGSVAALLAVGVLAIMVVSGRLREDKQLVRFVPAGVLPETPDQIDRVELAADGRRWVFVRAAHGWGVEPGGRPVPAPLGAHLDDSVKFMHVSAPIRVMERAEWAPLGLGEFGLDPPGYTVTLSRRGATVLGAAFGGPNPERVLQYMKLEGRDQVYLMSRFIGQEWEETLREATGR